MVVARSYQEPINYLYFYSKQKYIIIYLSFCHIKHVQIYTVPIFGRERKSIFFFENKENQVTWFHITVLINNTDL